jgi:hypothetical protein
MKNVKLITNQAGELAGFQVDINNEPEMAQEVFHLIGALQRARETTAPTPSAKREPISLHAFNKLIRQAKDRGERRKYVLGGNGFSA